MNAAIIQQGKAASTAISNEKGILCFLVLKHSKLFIYNTEIVSCTKNLI